MSTNTSSGSQPIRITPNNLETLEYIPKTGTEYEVAPGVVRRLLGRTYGIQRAFDAKLAEEDPNQFDPSKEGYYEPIRIECMRICTDGDEIPDEELLNLDVVARVAADFFTLRFLKPKPQSSLSE